MNKSVWVVDDDLSILEVTRIVLEDAGFNVKAIPNDRLLMEALHKEQPCLILLDIYLSGVDGRDVSKQIKSLPEIKNIPIIMMSAATDLRNKTKEGHADGFIKKPYDIFSLVEMINKHIRSKPAS